jgi:NAD(P)-dependent dehydrogenase (short-subunit alcohol dehydrogenase family)
VTGGAIGLVQALQATRDAEALIESAWQRVGELTGLVLDPVLPLLPSFADGERSAWRALLDDAVEMPFFVARECARRMAERRGGRIVVVVPARVTVQRPEFVALEVAAHALRSLASGLAAALPQGIAVATVIPPPMQVAAETVSAAAAAEAVEYALTAAVLARGTTFCLDPRRSASVA